MAGSKTDVPQGALDMLVLKTLQHLGATHGWGIARRIEQAAEDALSMNQGTLYPALVRLEQRGWIKSEWGVSDNNRRARFYELTRRGVKQLQAEEERWDRISAMIARFRQPFPEEGAP
jgi:transcriptional regulator